MNREQARRELGWGDEPVLITVATLVARKSIDTVIQSLPIVLEVIPACRYVIIGDGSERQALSALAEKLGVSQHVEFMGKVDDGRKHLLYRSSDVFVMVSRAVEYGVQEGFGITFLEANMHGLPVIGSRCGGIVEAVENGVNGLLVDQRAPDQVAGAVIALLRDPARRSHLARNGQERVRTRFNWPSIADRVAQRLRQLVPERLASEAPTKDGNHVQHR
jgi:phosphatidylinositol alpha-1,6-mannosyltransferase